MTNHYIKQADDELSLDGDDELHLQEYVEKAKENPTIAAHSAKYILQAIEHFGTRETFEDGEEKERYVFFDDPCGDGEHAILGNTDTLNDFVNELHRMASEEGKNEKIIWFTGPTATGKSELKRCLINGIRGFSQTEAGSRYTLKWSLDALSSQSRMSYGEETVAQDWYESPVNVHPLSVFPENARERIIEDVDENADYPTKVDVDLDPFSREAFNVLNEKYESFEDMVSSDHLQVERKEISVGDGIGVLHSEDRGDEKQRLVGGWMEGALEEFAERGRKNAQAFSYDGVLCQGNGTMSIVEDAGHHSDVLDKMINLCEEKMVKLDNKVQMDLDTLLVVISNPDLEEELSQYIEAGHADPLRALRRRMDKYNFTYLTTLSLEAMLIRRLLCDDYEIWDNDENRMETVAEPIELYDSEIAPRVIEAAAMYAVSSRVDNNGISPITHALLLENGKIENKKGEIKEYEDFDDLISEAHGNFGIPVTYTVDILVDVTQNEDVIVPEMLIDKMAENLQSEALFDTGECSRFANLAFDVKKYIFEKQEEDVLDAMVGDVSVTEEEVREYVDGVFAWQEESDDDDAYDAYELREFETRYLGKKSDAYEEEASPSPDVANFREDDVISPINKFLWDNRDDDFTVDDVPLSECPSLQPLIEENDWDMVNRLYPEASHDQWRSPPSNTQTEEIKEKTIERMIENMGYSEKSAETVSTKVVESANAEHRLEENNNGA